MRQLVCQGEHLRRLCICPVHEDQRGIGIGQRESSKLLDVELPGRVVADDTVDDGDYTEPLDAAPQLSHGLRPALYFRRPAVVEADEPPHFPSSRFRLVGKASAAYEVQRLAFTFSSLFAQPVLPALHRVDGVKKVGAGPRRARTNRAEVLNR